VVSAHPSPLGEGGSVIKALLQLARRPCLSKIEKIFFLGQEGVHSFETASNAAILFEREVGIQVQIEDGLDSVAAQQFLAKHAADSLVVIPSRAETLGYAIIEATQIRGLNLICSNATGIREIFNSVRGEQLFDPNAGALARKIEAWLDHEPRTATELESYNWQRANRMWLDFHREACSYRATNERIFQMESPHQDTPTENGKPSIDVYIPYFNLPKFLPPLLASLAEQTISDFQVIVVDDGSDDPQAVTAFQQMKATYEGRGWIFASQPNLGGAPPATRRHRLDKRSICASSIRTIWRCRRCSNGSSIASAAPTTTV